MRLRRAGIVSTAVLLSCAGTVSAAALATAATAAPRAALDRTASLPAAPGRFTQISVPGAIQTMPEAITDAGLIVGCYQLQAGPVLGFVDRNGRFSTVTDPAASRRSATRGCVLGASATGVLVGYYQTASGQFRGFIDRRGTFTQVSDPMASRGAGQGTRVLAINDAGVVVGSYSRRGREYGFELRRGIYTTIADPAAGGQRGGGTVLNGISDYGTISGGYVAAHSVIHAFVYRAGRFTALRVPAGSHSVAADTEAAGISPTSGLVVGSYRRTASSPQAGFSFRRGTYQTLKDPAATAGTEPQGGNDSGRIVGIYLTRGGVQHGFAFTPRR